MLLDAIRAAAWGGYRYFRADYWDELSPDDQAYTIAAYQIDREIDSLMQHEALEAARKAAKKPAKAKP